MVRLAWWRRGGQDICSLGGKTLSFVTSYFSKNNNQHDLNKYNNKSLKYVKLVSQPKWVAYVAHRLDRRGKRLGDPYVVGSNPAVERVDRFFGWMSCVARKRTLTAKSHTMLCIGLNLFCSAPGSRKPAQAAINKPINTIQMFKEKVWNAIICNIYCNDGYTGYCIFNKDSLLLYSI
jgi:hypothetical protein